MRVQDILEKKTGEVRTVRLAEPIERVCRRLRLEQVGAMLVCDDTGALAGIVTERDIVRGLGEYGARALAMTASDLMTPKPITCRPDTEISSIAKLMTDRRFRHVPVTSEGRLLGMVSIGDVVKHRIEEMELEANVLRDIATVVH